MNINNRKWLYIVPCTTILITGIHVMAHPARSESLLLMFMVGANWSSLAMLWITGQWRGGNE